MSDGKGGDTAAASSTLVSDSSTLVSNPANASAHSSNSHLPAASSSAVAPAADALASSKLKDGAGASPLEDGGVDRMDATHGEQDGEREDPNDDDVEDEDDDDAAELDTVAANDVKNIILQVLSPYFDDDAGTTADVAGVDALGAVAAAAGNVGASPAGSPNQATRDAAGLPNLAASPSSPTGGQEEEAGEDVAQRYDHVKSEMWIARICDGIMERLVGLGKPFKFVVHTMIMRKCGAGLHVCSSCYYAPSDGWLSHSHDLSAHLYAVVTVYWCAV